MSSHFLLPHLLGYVLYAPHKICREKRSEDEKRGLPLFPGRADCKTVAFFPHILNSFVLGLFEEFLINLLFK